MLKVKIIVFNYSINKQCNIRSYVQYVDMCIFGESGSYIATHS